MQSEFTFDRTHLWFHKRDQRKSSRKSKDSCPKEYFHLGWAPLGRVIWGSASGGSHEVQWEKLMDLEFPLEAVGRSHPRSSCLPQRSLRTGAAWLLSPAVAVGEPTQTHVCFCLKSVQFLVVFQPSVRGFETPSQATVRISRRSCVQKKCGLYL